MARFTETEQIRPASTFRFDTSSLTARLDSFAAQQAQIGAQKVAEQAYTRGQQAFAEGEQPEFKKEGFFGKIPAKAYNEGLRAAYVASIDRDNREEIARITAENPNNLAAYNDQVEAYRAATLNNVDPTARDVVSGSLDSLISSSRIKVQNNEIAKTHKENAREVSNQIEAATDDALGFARDGNAESSAESALAAFMGIQSRVAMGDISDAEAATQQRNLDRAITEEFKLGELVRTFDDEGEQAAFTRLDELSGKRPGGFAPDEWDSFISRSQTELNRKAARLERESIANAKAAQKEMDFSSVEARVAGDDTQIINPKVADSYYNERVLPQIQNQPPEVQRAVTAEYVDRLKLVPDTVVKEVTNAANSNNPELLANAARLIDRIDDIHGVVNKVPVEQQAYIQTVTNLMENMSPEEAVKLAREATNPKDKNRIEAVESLLKAQKTKSPSLYLYRSESAFKKLFVWNDPVPDELSKHQMAKEYGDLYEAFRKAGSSESDAFDKADKTIKRNWGVSTALDKPSVMKYPPEDYYSVDGDAAWIKNQLYTDVREEVFGADIQDIFLMSNDQTARTAEIGQPTYAVKVMIDGVFYTLSDNWMPDMKTEVEARKTENVEAALARRQKRMDRGIDAADFDRNSLRAL